MVVVERKDGGGALVLSHAPWRRWEFADGDAARAAVDDAAGLVDDGSVDDGGHGSDARAGTRVDPRAQSETDCGQYRVDGPWVYGVIESIGETGPVVGRVLGEADIDIDPPRFAGPFADELLRARPPRMPPASASSSSSSASSSSSSSASSSSTTSSPPTLSPAQLAQLRDSGFLEWRGALPASAAAVLRDEARKMEASMERSGQDPSIRRDRLLFVDVGGGEAEPRGPLHAGFKFLEGLGAQVGSWQGHRLLRPPQGMLACYPGEQQAFYTAHLDNERDAFGFWRNHRALTAILYLGAEDWAAADGGALQCAELDVEVLPRAGTVVLFDSQAVRHAVAPTSRPHRLAVSLWFVTRRLLCEDAQPPVGPELNFQLPEAPSAAIAIAIAAAAATKKRGQADGGVPPVKKPKAAPVCTVNAAAFADAGNDKDAPFTLFG